MSDVSIAGSALRLGLAENGGIEAVVKQVVDAALASAGMNLDAVDTVVTVGTDILDGSMVATRSGIAGAFGKSLVTVPSSAGHGIAAAVSLIESGQAETVLLAGWGEGSKFAGIDGRIIQADPFYARPVVREAAALAVLQAQRLFATGRLDPQAMAHYGGAMRARAGRGNGTSGGGGWLGTGWCDGAAALVLTAADGGGVVISDFGSAFQPYCPEPEDLDPAAWVRDALMAMRDGNALPDTPLAVIEASAPTPFCEAIALADILSQHGWSADDPRVNPSGGGAVACFGPATGLARLVAASEALKKAPRTGRVGGLVVDLAGPIGQAATVILLEAGSTLQ